MKERNIKKPLNLKGDSAEDVHGHDSSNDNTIWKIKSLSFATKFRLYKSVIVPIILCG